MIERQGASEGTILVVDDEEYNVDYLEQVLSDLGYQTREAYGGQEALESVASEPPDLILLDVMMPDIDGITVCSTLKSDPKTQLIPIVIMTALDGQEDRIRGIEAGADDFLTKPVDERELIARINSLLRTKHAVDQTADELESATAKLEELGKILGVDLSDQDQPTAATTPTRQLKTIFFSDIVGSTEMASRLGDEAWTGRIDDHFRLVRDNLSRFGGEEISTAGDGFLALFDSPANAIRAGYAISDHSADIDLLVRVGIHTGELERSGQVVSGIAVHLAARVSAQADASQVLVTSTTKEAVAGSGLQFVSQGLHELKGIEGERELFLAVHP